MGGEWTFSFEYQNQETLDIAKYQQFVRKLRQEFESEFSIMDPMEGSVEWAQLTEKNVPVSNVFATFTYNCNKAHIVKNNGHGTWRLYWNPMNELNAKNDIHARCAPMLFKDLSNQIQTKLVLEFPDHFAVKWKNGLTGYEGYDTFKTNQRYNTEPDDEVLRQMMVAMKWNATDSGDDERCIHHIPWSYCSHCSEDIMEMHGY